MEQLRNPCPEEHILGNAESGTFLVQAPPGREIWGPKSKDLHFCKTSPDVGSPSGWPGRIPGSFKPACAQAPSQASSIWVSEGKISDLWNRVVVKAKWDCMSNAYSGAWKKMWSSKKKKVSGESIKFQLRNVEDTRRENHNWAIVVRISGCYHQSGKVWWETGCLPGLKAFPPRYSDWMRLRNHDK